MKKILISTITIIIAMTGCDYLDIVPDNTPTLEDAFRDERTSEAFLYSCYSFIPVFNAVREQSPVTSNPGWLTSNETVASYNYGSQWFSFLQIQQAEHNPSKPVLDIWGNMYKGIRQCYIFLENVDHATPIGISQDEFEEKKRLWKAEAKFLIAFFHWTLLQNYGPIVVLDAAIPLNARGDEFFKPRSSYDESVAFIAKMFDEAIVDLPSTITGAADFGRPSKVIAQALKSRLYLYAASPLYNGNTDYADFKNHDGKVLISQTYDREKWKKAMDETKTAIDMAEAAGMHLYEYTKTPISDPFEKAVMTARWQMVDHDNPEVIWPYTGTKYDTFQMTAIPRGFGNPDPIGGVGATLNAVELFYSKKGLPADKDPDYDWAGRFTIPSGKETITLHLNREPRFYGFIGYDRGKYEVNDEVKVLRMRAGEKNGPGLTNGVPDLNVTHLYAGYAVKKVVHPSTSISTSSWSAYPYHFPIIRLGELYLNYAEAVANYAGSLDAVGSNYLDAVRSRAGIPSLQSAYGRNLTGDALVQAVRRERLIELMFEGHSIYDRKRWKTAVSDFAGDKNGMRGLTSTGMTAEQFYTPRVLVGRSFIFEAKHYLFPIYTEWIRVNENLVQNPGW